MRRRSPQNKKHLSYERDRRNCYGENSKSSRKAIPLRKAKTRRAHRTKVKAILAQVEAAADLVTAESVGERAASVRRSEWKKVPDCTLAESIGHKLEGRKQRHDWKNRRTYNKVQSGRLPKQWLRGLPKTAESLTVVMRRDGKWWIGCLKEIPGVNRQSRTRAELLRSLASALKAALNSSRVDDEPLVQAAEELFLELDKRERNEQDNSSSPVRRKPDR